MKYFAQPDHSAVELPAGTCWVQLDGPNSCLQRSYSAPICSLLTFLALILRHRLPNLTAEAAVFPPTHLALHSLVSVASDRIPILSPLGCS